MHRWLESGGHSLGVHGPQKRTKYQINHTPGSSLTRIPSGMPHSHPLRNCDFVIGIPVSLPQQRSSEKGSVRDLRRHLPSPLWVKNK